MVYIVPVLALAGGLGPGYWLGLRGRWRPGALLLALLLIASVWMVMEGRRHQGWDALGYAITLWLMLMPAALGLAGGLLLGLYRRRRRRQKAGHD